MHIAQFTNTYHPLVSGVVRHVSTLRQAFTELGHNVFIFTQNTRGYKDSEPFIFRYPTTRFSLPMDFPLILPISPCIDKLLPQLKLNVIHTHHPFSLGHSAVYKAEKLKVPVIFTFHTQYWEHAHYLPISHETVQKFYKVVIDHLLTRFIQKCQRIVVYTDSVRDLLTDKYELEERIDVVPTAIDLQPYQNVDRRAIRAQRGWENNKILISVGRLAQEKNWRTLLDAGAQVMCTHKNLRIALIGDGPERRALQRYVHERGIADRVDFIGKIPFEKVPCYLAAADLFGFASVTETLGRVTMEALAAGLPVVAVDAIGTRDIVEHGQVGFLTDNNGTALAVAIRQVLDNPVLLHRFKKAATKKAQSFSIELEAKKLLDVYYQAIEDNRAIAR